MKKKKKQSQKVNEKYNNAGDLSPNPSPLSGNCPDEILIPSYDHSNHNHKLQNRRRLFTRQLFPVLEESFIKQMVSSEKECYQDKGDSHCHETKDKTSNTFMIAEIVLAMINDCFPNIEPKGNKHDQTEKISTEVQNLAPIEPGKHLEEVTPWSSPATDLTPLPSRTSNREKIINMGESIEFENLNTGTSKKSCTSPRLNRVGEISSATKDKTYNKTYECKVVLRRLPINFNPVNGNRKQFDPGKEDTPIKHNSIVQRCKFCDKTFDTKSKLWDHIAEHLEIDAKLSLSKNKSCQFPDCNIKNCKGKTILDHLAFDRRGIYEIDKGSITLFNNGTKDFYKASQKISSSFSKDTSEILLNNQKCSSQNSVHDLTSKSEVTKQKLNSRKKGMSQKKNPSFVESYLFEKCSEGFSGDDETTNTEYAVESILDKRMTSKTHEYLVKWKEYSEEESTWEPAESLDCFHLIKEFQANFSVDRIADMRKSTITRDVCWSRVEYLVKWKGFDENYDTWEPLEVLSCPKMINEFEKRSGKSDKSIRSILNYRKDETKKSNTAMGALKGFRRSLENYLSEESSDTDASSEDDTATEKDYTVQKIVSSRVVGKNHEYLIKWKGLETAQNTWERAENLNSTDLIRTYQRFWDIDKVLDKRHGKGKNRPDNWSGIEYLVKWKGFDDQFNTWEPLDVLCCVEQIQKFEKSNPQYNRCSRDRTSNIGNPNALKKYPTQEKRVYRNKKTREELIVERINARRITSEGTLEYLIKWRSFGEHYDDDHSKLMGITWEPLENLECNELIKQFENENPRSRKLKTNVPRTTKNHSKKNKKIANVTSSFPNEQPFTKRFNKVSNVHEAYDYLDEYSVESILERDVYSTDNVEYFVKWKGYSDKENTWEPANNLYCFDLIKIFLSTYSIDTIIKKRIVEVEENVNRTGIEYLVKWKGYPNKYNTWEPLEVLECNNLIREYEKTTLDTKKCRPRSEIVSQKNKRKTGITRNTTTSNNVTEHLQKKQTHLASNETGEYKDCQHEKLERKVAESTTQVSEVKIIHFAKTISSPTTTSSRNHTNALERNPATESVDSPDNRIKRRKIIFED